MVWRVGTLTRLVRYQWLAQLAATVIREKYGIVCNIFVLAHACITSAIVLAHAYMPSAIVLAHACVCAPSHVSQVCTIRMIASMLEPLVRDHSSNAGPRPRTQIPMVWHPSLNYL